MLIKNKQSEKRVAKLSTKSYEKLELLVEDLILIKKMKESKKEDRLELSEAKSFYRHLLTSNS